METLLPVILKGFLLGIMVAAPVGPIAVLCFSRTLTYGFLAGFSCALGVALADGFFAAVAGFGITLISDFLFEYQTLIKIFGGGFLAFLGVKTFMKKTVKEISDKDQSTLAGGFAKGLGLTFAITLTNPLTIILFISLFGTAGFNTVQEGYLPVAFLVTGVFLGTLSWKSGLCLVANLLRHKASTKNLLRLNKLSGVILLGFGSYFVLSTLL